MVNFTTSFYAVASALVLYAQLISSTPVPTSVASTPAFHRAQSGLDQEGQLAPSRILSVAESTERSNSETSFDQHLTLSGLQAVARRLEEFRPQSHTDATGSQRLRVSPHPKASASTSKPVPSGNSQQTTAVFRLNPSEIVGAKVIEPQTESGDSEIQPASSPLQKKPADQPLHKQYPNLFGMDGFDDKGIEQLKTLINEETVNPETPHPITPKPIVQKPYTYFTMNPLKRILARPKASFMPVEKTGNEVLSVKSLASKVFKPAGIPKHSIVYSHKFALNELKLKIDLFSQVLLFAEYLWNEIWWNEEMDIQSNPDAIDDLDAWMVMIETDATDDIAETSQKLSSQADLKSLASAVDAWETKVNAKAHALVIAASQREKESTPVAIMHSNFAKFRGIKVLIKSLSKELEAMTQFYDLKKQKNPETHAKYELVSAKSKLFMQFLNDFESVLLRRRQTVPDVIRVAEAIDVMKRFLLALKKELDG